MVKVQIVLKEKQGGKKKDRRSTDREHSTHIMTSPTCQEKLKPKMKEEYY